MTEKFVPIAATIAAIVWVSALNAESVLTAGRGVFAIKAAMKAAITAWTAMTVPTNTARTAVHAIIGLQWKAVNIAANADFAATAAAGSARIAKRAETAPMSALIAVYIAANVP